MKSMLDFLGHVYRVSGFRKLGNKLPAQSELSRLTGEIEDGHATTFILGRNATPRDMAIAAKKHILDMDSKKSDMRLRSLEDFGKKLKEFSDDDLLEICKEMSGVLQKNSRAQYSRRVAIKLCKEFIDRKNKLDEDYKMGSIDKKEHTRKVNSLKRKMANCQSYFPGLVEFDEKFTKVGEPNTRRGRPVKEEPSPGNIPPGDSEPKKETSEPKKDNANPRGSSVVNTSAEDMRTKSHRVMDEELRAYGSTDDGIIKFLSDAETPSITNNSDASKGFWMYAEKLMRSVDDILSRKDSLEDKNDAIQYMTAKFGINPIELYSRIVGDVDSELEKKKEEGQPVTISDYNIGAAIASIKRKGYIQAYLQESNKDNEDMWAR